jgi:hypothetical protein
LLAYLSYRYPIKELAYPAIIVAIAWILIWTFSLRDTGIEVLGDSNKIWWNNLRPLHATIYILFAYSIYHLDKSSYKYLLLDAAIGLGAFLLK